MEQKFFDMKDEMCIIVCLSLPTDTAVPSSLGEDGILRGENCTGQLKIERLWLL